MPMPGRDLLTNPGRSDLLEAEGSSAGCCLGPASGDGQPRSAVI
jgi:hypothetical protein